MKLFNLGGKPKEDQTPREDERRKDESDASYKGPERRSSERRGLGCGLKFRTERAVGPIEEWLHDNMPDDHYMSIEDISEDFYTKDIRVVFANAEQRTKFKEALAYYVQNGEFR
ncbi:MAG: hypothetical protein JJ900_03435 [Rhodospirillales bacterium]|nr:hypothetical protein [Rhodospirillales bacterium]MBO6785878.1 hypothetical protein [Rhodospirillales bacterium]